MNLSARMWPPCALLLAAALFARPHALHAQSADSTTFRPGQWAAEFALVSSLPSLGVLRFSTPSRAWIGSLRGEVIETRGDPDSLSSGLGVATAYRSRRVGELRLGHRWYRGVSNRIAQHVTVGALASGIRVHNKPGIFPDYRESEVGAGLFADVGALWFVTKRLSLGAAWGVDASYERNTRSGTGSTIADEVSSTQHRVNVGQVRVQGALYF